MSRSPVLMQKSRGHTTHHSPSTGRQRKEESRSCLARQSSQISELQFLWDTLSQKQEKKTLNINLRHVSLHRHTHSIKMLSYKIEKVEEHTPAIFFFCTSSEYKLQGNNASADIIIGASQLTTDAEMITWLTRGRKCCLLSAFSSYNLSIPYISLAYLNT